MTTTFKLALAAALWLTLLAGVQGQPTVPGPMPSGQAIRDVGGISGPSTGFHGALGSNALQSFRGFTSGVPMFNGGASYSPLDPMNRPVVTPGAAAGLANVYRVTGSGGPSVGPISPVIRGTSEAPWEPLPGLPASSYFTPPAMLGLPQLPLPALDTTVNPAAEGEAALPAGSPEAEQDQAEADAAPNPTRAVRFDLAGQLKASRQWARAADLLARKQYAKAAEAARVGLVLRPGRPEGEWLVAVADVALEDYSDAVIRLRNALAVCPDLLAAPRGMSGLLPAAMIGQRLDAASGVEVAKADKAGGATPAPGREASRLGASTEGAKVPAEQLLVAAWMALELGRTDQAKAISFRLADLVGAALPVAGAIRRETGGSNIESPRSAESLPIAAAPATFAPVANSPGDDSARALGLPPAAFRSVPGGGR